MNATFTRPEQATNRDGEETPGSIGVPWKRKPERSAQAMRSTADLVRLGKLMGLETVLC